ncbi:MAG: hypothetical protein ACI4OJ_10230 [Lachnospiraceae bacterium]
MKKNRTLFFVSLALVAVSVTVYLLQVLIFRDPRTTEFYIFQDFAFLPISIAVATLAVNALMADREKRDKIAHTSMLRSQFFTGVGVPMLRALSDCCKIEGELPALSDQEDSPKDRERAKKKIEDLPLSVHLDETAYNRVRSLLEESRTELLILGSNPDLMEAECFTQLLWGIFHLLDEYRLRGNWQDLKADDISHLEEDFARVLRLILVNNIDNAVYLRTHFPNFYGTARARLAEELKSRRG